MIGIFRLVVSGFFRKFAAKTKRMKKKFSFEDDPSFGGHSAEWWEEWRRNANAQTATNVCDGCLNRAEDCSCSVLEPQEQSEIIAIGRCDEKLK